MLGPTAPLPIFGQVVEARPAQTFGTHRLVLGFGAQGPVVRTHPPKSYVDGGANRWDLAVSVSSCSLQNSSSLEFPSQNRARGMPKESQRMWATSLDLAVHTLSGHPCAGGLVGPVGGSSLKSPK